MLLRNKKLRIFIGAAIFLAALFLSVNIQVLPALADTLGQKQSFIVNSTYDKFSRTQAAATLIHISSKAYFYVDDRYWDNLNQIGRNDLTDKIYDLASAFDNVIYPKETEFWGSEPNPGIDGDPKITIVLEQLISGNGGYFDTINGYAVESSNKREIFFASVEAVNTNIQNAKMFLAHEFQHLISFNQKDILRKVTEDVWLNELRSEYSVSLVGYNEPYVGSSLERRADLFTEQPSDSLTEWPNVSLDYAQIALFGEYLVEQYGPEILKETLHGPYIGIESINNFLISRNYKERFSDIFGNWAIANYINDISSDKKFGYTAEGLKDIKITPLSNINLLNQLAYSFYYSLKPWQPAWYKFNIGQSVLVSKAIKIDFSAGAYFRIFYADNLGRAGVLSNSAYVDDPGGLTDFVIIPINQSKVSDFGKNDTSAAFSFSINFVDAGLGRGLSALKDGLLIKRPNEKEMYVIDGKYKRYLNPGVIALYGQLDPAMSIELDDALFNSYAAANYVREANDKKVYAVWPDGTKHWLNMAGEYFAQSGRDWGSIFVINQLELNFYKTGVEITK